MRSVGWPTPTGLPDDDSLWLGANALRRRWSLIAGLTENWWGTGPLKLAGGPPQTAEAFLDQWSPRLHGHPQLGQARDILDTLQWPANRLVSDEGQARRLVAWLAMAPAFQIRGDTP